MAIRKSKMNYEIYNSIIFAKRMDVQSKLGRSWSAYINKLITSIMYEVDIADASFNIKVAILSEML